jgi:Tol biopolymer transport system component
MTRTFTIRKLAAVAVAGLLGAVLLGAQKSDQADVLLQAAINKEMVQGDLKGAIEQYKKLADGSDKAIAAKALLRLAGCYERLGQDDAKKVYERILRDFAGQTEAASEARTRLTALTRTGDGTTGMVARQVWEDASLVGGGGAISPDGRHLVYVGPGIALYVRDLPTGLNRRLTLPASAGDTARPNGALTFSPDGKLIASGWWDREGTGRTEMRFVTLDGSAPPVFHQGNEWNALAPNDWSADGKQVLALGNHIVDGHTYIVLVFVADGSVHELKALGMNYHHPRMMSLSRDGRYVVYDQPARGDSGERDIFILSTHGGQEARLVARAADDGYPVWTPDGRGVLFLSARAGSTGAWFLRVVDGKPQGSPELVKRDMGQIVPIGFTRNGSLYYSEQPEMGELYLATLDPTSGTITSQPATVTQRLVTTTHG